MMFEELKAKAASLPLEPGVYIMKDKTDQVIYVGKAKKLRNRVSQYFVDTVSHSPKTRLMVSKIDHFEVIVASTEFEALVLECSLIKRHMPKYNILLKDDKGYPYLRLDMRDDFPVISLVNKPENDGASYYGPYGSRGITKNVLETVNRILKLPTCSKSFPADIGKGRTCLNFHIGQCAGWCRKTECKDEYRALMEQARQLLTGNYRQVTQELKQQMLEAAENLNFELAAALRDRITAVENLKNKQLVTAGASSDMDVIGYGQTPSKGCFAVLHFSGGDLIDKDYEIINLPDDGPSAVSSLVKQYYLSRGFAPKNVLLPFKMADSALFEDLLYQHYSKKTYIKVPQKGDNMRLVELACKNALEEAERITTKEEHTAATLTLLGKMLSMDAPVRIESFDISNISGTDNVASMVVFQNGKPKKSEYKRFKVDLHGNQDDYGSMYHVLYRRLTDYKNGIKGFDLPPSVLMIDGGVGHVNVAKQVLLDLKLDFPVFGMVKDDRHRTRALINADGQQIRIDNQPSIFALIGNIQEETHRFAVGYHRKLRSKRLQYSELDKIPGIGPKRKQELLRCFSSITAIRQADIGALERILPKDAAHAVYEHFHQEG